MAIMYRSIIVILFVVGSLCPSLATAQCRDRVYRVLTSSSDEVRIGTLPNASMEDVVLCARAIAHNDELSASDVIRNNPRAVRYACRDGSDDAYYGRDPGYAGRCPDPEHQRLGVLRDAVYRIPRESGVTLAPRVVRPRSGVSPAADVFAANERALNYARELERVTEERDEARERYAASETAINTAEGAQAAAEEERDEAVTALEAANATIETLRAELAEANAALAAPLTVPPAVEPSAPGDGEEIERLTREAEGLRAENDRLQRELAAARGGEVSLESRLDGRSLWWWLLLVIVLMIALFFILLWPIRWAFLLAPRERDAWFLGRVANLERYLKVAEADLKKVVTSLKKEEARTRSLAKRRTRLVRNIVFYRNVWHRAEAALAQALPRIEALKAFRNRKAQIVEHVAHLAELREQEDPIINTELLLQEAMQGLEDAQAREDASGIESYGELVRVYSENLKELGDATELRNKIAGLVAVLEHDFAEQCGIGYDTRPGDQKLAELEKLRLDILRQAEAKRKVTEDLALLAERQGLEGLEKLAQRRRELEHEFAAKDGAFLGKLFLFSLSKSDADAHLASNEKTFTRLREQLHLAHEQLEEHKSLLAALIGEPDAQARYLLQYQARITDLKKKLEDAGLDPGPDALLDQLLESEPSSNGTPAMGVPRPRIPTQGMAALRDSQLPGPPSSPLAALNRDIYRFLDTLRSIPPGNWVIDCNDDAGRDWAFLLNNCFISVPKIGQVVELKSYVKAVKSRAPDWLTERQRRPTNPPPAAATG